MSFLKMIDRKKAISAYLFIGIAINGFFSIYLLSDNPSTPRFAWYFLAIIGGVILIGKTFKFNKKDQLKIILMDSLFILIFVNFALISMPWGINFIIGSILGVLFLYFIIDKTYLQYLD